MSFTNDELLQMYDDIVKARVMGEKIVEYIFSGKIAGAIHPCLGQEAISAGLLAAYRKSGLKIYATATHRSQTVTADKIGWGGFIAELLGKKSGENDGISGEYHVTNMDKGVVLGTGALGGAWAILDGVAWSLKHEGREKKEVVVAPYGDGASSQGATYEAMAFAALRKLPILFFIENNQYAMSTPVERQYPTKNLSDRAKAFGMKGVTVDGNDPVAVAEAVLEGLESATHCVPGLVEAQTLRWEGHFVGDPQPYRDLSFKEHLDDIDPVLHFEQKLRGMGLLNDEDVKRVREQNVAMIEGVFAEGIADVAASKEEVLDYNRVYSNFSGGLK